MKEGFMTDTQLKRMAQAAAVIRRVVGVEFKCEQPGLRPYGKDAVLILLHDLCDPLAAYVNYDCQQYAKIERLSEVLAEIGLFVEDCTGDYSAVYEVTPITEGVSDGMGKASQDRV